MILSTEAIRKLLNYSDGKRNISSYQLSTNEKRAFTKFINVDDTIDHIDVLYCIANMLDLPIDDFTSNMRRSVELTKQILHRIES